MPGLDKALPVIASVVAVVMVVAFGVWGMLVAVPYLVRRML